MSRCWENTLPAFSRAIEKNYTIECDVRLTLDGDAVVFHDGDLNRLAGQEGYVWQRTAAEMQALSIGGTRDHAPTLKETLDFVAGRVPIVIELKGIPGHDRGLVERVGDLLRTYPGKAAIMSFDHWLIRDFPICARHSGRPDRMGHRDAGDRGAFFHARARHRLRLLCRRPPAEPVRHLRARRLGMPVISWTVRDEAAVGLTFKHADQMTFEGFEPEQFRLPELCALAARAGGAHIPLKTQRSVDEA